MRIVFSLLGLVMVLAIVSWLVTRQLNPAPAPAAPRAGQAEVPQLPVVTPGNARQVQDQVRAELDHVMQQAASREMP
ncbi:hypothetical protein CCO03_06530 [Comamonas serinivorans]|uniref:Uncharacterized protein n=1 Tax=Comamonas serinivorans TaxID=1082851 RepID=A0A1Y0EL60_9BURK|nr:hypothetical protein [Comamonas serinivorans]ARU04375.1 hypothetical protein CCO03_06530 [Comamonas serinivorans]